LRSFDLFDQERKGYLTADDIRRVADELGERITPEEIQSMIEEFDMDGDGAISRDDFLEICMN
jgi:centrin-3